MKRPVKRIRKKTGFITALLLLTCMVLNLSSPALASDMGGTDNSPARCEDMGIKKVLQYSEDKTSARAGADLTDVDTARYHIEEIKGPEGLVLDLSAPVVTVGENGDYTFAVTYKEVTDGKESNGMTAEFTITVDEIALQSGTDGGNNQADVTQGNESKEDGDGGQDGINSGQDIQFPDLKEAAQPEALLQNAAGRAADGFFSGVRMAYSSYYGTYLEKHYITWRIEGNPDKVLLEIFNDEGMRIRGPIDVTGKKSLELGDLRPNSAQLPPDRYRYVDDGLTYRFTAETGNYKQIFRGKCGIFYQPRVYQQEHEETGLPLGLNFFQNSPVVSLNMASVDLNNPSITLTFDSGEFKLDPVLAASPLLLASRVVDLEGEIYDELKVYTRTIYLVGNDQKWDRDPIRDGSKAEAISEGYWRQINTKGLAVTESRGTLTTVAPLQRKQNLFRIKASRSIQTLFQSKNVVNQMNNEIVLTYYYGDYYTMNYNANYPAGTTGTGTVPSDGYTLYEWGDRPSVKDGSDLKATGAGYTYEMVGWSRTKQNPSANPTPEYTAGGKYNTSGTSGGITQHGTLYAVWKQTPVQEVSVSKEVSGVTDRSEFDFTVKFTAENGDAYTSPVEIGKGTDKEQTVITGEAEFKLKDGEKINMLIPEGVYYEVVEKDYSGERAKTTVTASAAGETAKEGNATGRLMASDTGKGTVKFNNTYTAVYDFTIQEFITGSGANMKRDFQVKAQFYSKDGSELSGLSYEGTKGAKDSAGAVSGTLKEGGVTFVIPHEGTVVFKEVPDNACCKIWSDDGGDGYTWYVDGKVESDGTVTGGTAQETDGSCKITVTKDKTSVQTIHYKGITVPTGTKEAKFPLLPAAAGGGAVLLILFNIFLKRRLGQE